MNLYSTNRKSSQTDFRNAVLCGLASDGGLFMPEQLPDFGPGFYHSLRGKKIPEIAFEVFRRLVGDEFSPDDLKTIIERSLTFDAPLVTLEEGLHVLELFHGPTLAFKDFGAQAMAAIMSHFSAESGRQMTILTATSGDTGAAVAHGFAGASGIDVYILYPSGKVSKRQEKQFTTLGGNIKALEVDGTFDDCQRMVKSAFADEELVSRRNLTTANSINIARLLPQMIYYIYAFTRLPENHAPVIFSVPSGNFGNLTAGILAAKTGLPVEKFIASTNQNNVVPEYLSGHPFRPRPSLKSISNAMDVGNPSNFARLTDLYNNDRKLMQKDIWGTYFSDTETGEALLDAYNQFGYLFDPHGAVGYAGLKAYRDRNRQGKNHSAHKTEGIVLATAHPAKFPEIVQKLTGNNIPAPVQLSELSQKKKLSVALGNRYDDLRSHLLD